MIGKLAVIAATAVLLAGCYYQAPPPPPPSPYAYAPGPGYYAPGYYAAPGYYYGPPVYGSVVVRGHWH